MLANPSHAQTLPRPPASTITSVAKGYANDGTGDVYVYLTWTTPTMPVGPPPGTYPNYHYNVYCYDGNTRLTYSGAGTLTSHYDFSTSPATYDTYADITAEGRVGVGFSPLKNGDTYTFYVVTVDGGGQSGPSNSVTAVFGSNPLGVDPATEDSMGQPAARPRTATPSHVQAIKAPFSQGAMPDFIAGRFSAITDDQYGRPMFQRPRITQSTPD